LIGFDKKCLIRPSSGAPVGGMSGRKTGKNYGSTNRTGTPSIEKQGERRKKTIRNVHKKAGK